MAGEKAGRVARRLACAAGLLLGFGSREAKADELVALSESSKLHGAHDAELPRSPWRAHEPVAIEMLPGEIVGAQIVRPPHDHAARHATLEIVGDAPTGIRARTFVERFVHVARPSGNTNEPGSLGFTERAAPGGYTGWIADPLVDGESQPVDAGVRSAWWIDIEAAPDAPGTTARFTLRLRVDGVIEGERALRIHVAGPRLATPEKRPVVYFDRTTLVRRMGSLDAERSLRQIVHAHGAIAFTEEDPDGDLEMLRASASGALYRADRGYDGPFVGMGDDRVIVGAYGAFGAPTHRALDALEKLLVRADLVHAEARARVVLYAIDEDCESPIAPGWRVLLATRETTRRVAVAATCDADPRAQRWQVPILPTSHFRRPRARLAMRAGQEVWVYNGIRPHAGSLLLDVPASDLRANGWIAERYPVARWLYWESAFWLDGNRGGKGKERGWDPFVVAEAFHNDDGDYANGDGILVYPGHQPAEWKMVDLGAMRVLPSVRLKNLRRGVMDGELVRMAMHVDRAATLEIVREMIPKALGHSRERVAWPEDGASWNRARNRLVSLIRSGKGAGVRPSPSGARSGCATTPSRPGLGPLALAAGLIVIGLIARRRAGRDQ